MTKTELYRGFDVHQETIAAEAGRHGEVRQADTVTNDLYALEKLLNRGRGTDKLKLVVNRAKSRAVPLKACSFLGFQIGTRGKVTWTAKALARFKERVRKITSRNRGHRVADVIDELRLYY